MKIFYIDIGKRLEKKLIVHIAIKAIELDWNDTSNDEDDM